MLRVKSYLTLASVVLALGLVGCDEQSGGVGDDDDAGSDSLLKVVAERVETGLLYADSGEGRTAESHSLQLGAIKVSVEAADDGCSDYTSTAYSATLMVGAATLDFEGLSYISSSCPNGESVTTVKTGGLTVTDENGVATSYDGEQAEMSGYLVETPLMIGGKTVLFRPFAAVQDTAGKVIDTQVMFNLGLE